MLCLQRYAQDWSNYLQWAKAQQTLQKANRFRYAGKLLSGTSFALAYICHVWLQTQSYKSKVSALYPGQLSA